MAAVVKNKIDKSFGPTGSFAGLLLFFIGLILTWFSLAGIILILLGAFVGFTYTATMTDAEQHRIRYTQYLFGFIPLGHWIRITADMKIELRRPRKVWSSYSRSNRTLDITDERYVIFLFDAHGKKIMPIKKFQTLSSAKDEMEELQKQLQGGQ